MDVDSDVMLTIRGVFDPQSESVGLCSEASDSFSDGNDTRAKIEVLAALAAKANCIASEVIRTFEQDQSRRTALYEHFASLKEQMLNDMLRQMAADDT